MTVYKRKNSKRLLFDCCKQYAIDTLSEISNLGESEIIDNAIENMTFEMYSDVIALLDRIDSNKMEQSLYSSHNSLKFFYKQNPYNLNLLGDDLKIKIFSGTQSFIADENFLIASEKYPNYFEEFLLQHRNRHNYRIEIYKLTQGLTVDDILRKDITDYGVYYSFDSEVFDDNKQKKEYVSIIKNNQKDRVLKDGGMDAIFALLANYLYDKVHTTETGGKVYYPNDFNTGNFVIDYDNMHNHPFNLVNIDYDHMCIHSQKQMIHNAAWSFFSRIFDENSLPNDEVDDFVVEYRTSRTLLDEVERFKTEYLVTIGIKYDSECERYDYPIGLHALNNNKEMFEHVNSIRAAKYADPTDTVIPEQEDEETDND